MELSKGFITVATGDYYCWLAENLIMSYKLFSDTKYPMYVITDKKGQKRLNKVFDGVVVLDNPYYTFMDKMTVYQNSPFDETIFLDADMDIIRDISYLFSAFEENGSDISCVGEYRDITESIRPNHFGITSINEFGLKRYIAFGGGIYYYKRGEKADRVFSTIFDVLIPNYDKYELIRLRNGQMADEPLMGLSMLINQMDPLISFPCNDMDIMKFHDNMMQTLKWDMKGHSCTFIWWEGIKVSPSIVHYGTHNTYTKKYVYYNSLVRGKYKKIPKILIPLSISKNEIVLACRHLAIKSDRQALWNWFKDHFTREYLMYKTLQLKRLFARTQR